MDFEGRVHRHEFTPVAVDEEHRLVTATYARSKVIQRRHYRRRMS
jgi:hypothetical protein